MRRSIFAVFMTIAVVQSFGQFSFSNLSFSASSQPEPDGSTIMANLGYSFSDSFSSSIRFKRLVTAETEELDMGKDAASGKALTTYTQNLKRSDITELFVLPAEITLKVLTPRGISVGAGLYASFNGIRNVGFFRLDTSIPSLSALPKTNSYDSTSSSRFFGPVLTLETEFSASFFSFQPQIVIVPLFFFSETSDLAIDPLLSSVGKGAISYSSTGLPYISLSGKGRLFNLVGIDLVYELSRQNAQLISAPDGTHTTWWGDPKVITSSTVKLIGNVILPIGRSGELTLGAGPNFSTSSVEGGSSATVSKAVFNIGYSLSK